MCLIMYKPKGVKVKNKDLKEWLTEGAISNHDGNGIAIGTKDSVFWKKGILLPELLNLAGRYNHEDFEVVTHSRTGTSGGKTEEFTHPFLISKERDHKTILEGELQKGEMLLFHNGIFYDSSYSGYGYYTNKVAIKDVNVESDTSLMASILKKHADWITNDPRFFTNLFHKLDGTSKIILFSKEGVFRTPNFTPEGKIFFSNQGYKSARTWVCNNSRQGYYEYEDIALPMKDNNNEKRKIYLFDLTGKRIKDERYLYHTTMTYFQTDSGNCIFFDIDKYKLLNDADRIDLASELDNLESTYEAFDRTRFIIDFQSEVKENFVNINLTGW